MNAEIKKQPSPSKSRQSNQVLGIWPRLIYQALYNRWDDAEELVNSSGLTVEEIISCKSMAFDRVALFLLKAVERHGDELTYEVSRLAKVNCLGAAGMILQAAPNLNVLFKTVIDTKKGFSPHSTMEFKRSLTAFAFEVRYPAVAAEISAIWVYITAVVAVDLCSRMPALNKVQVTLTHGPDQKFLKKRDDLCTWVIKEDMFGGVPGIRISFPAEVAYMQNPFFIDAGHFPEMLRLASKAERHLVSKLKEPQTLIDQINSLVLLHKTSLDKTFICDRLGYSHRSFDRKLAAENTNWRKAKAHAMRSLCKFLETEDRSKTEIASQLGFSNVKALEKALSYAV